MGAKLHELLNDDRTHHAWVFWCPACGTAHEVSRQMAFNGDLERPTVSGSVLVHRVAKIGRRRCHAYVTAGKIAYLHDSEHAMKGKTVDIPDWDSVPPSSWAPR